MSLYNITYADALKKAPHFIALGQTDVYLRGGDMPWEKATDIESSAAHRFNGPSGFYVVAEEAGLRFKWDVDFEGRDASGRGVSLFEAGRLRDTAGMLPAAVRVKLGQFLTDKVVPDLHKRTEEIRTSLQQQQASEDCVRNLIAFCNLTS